jgi:hypothetical protein
MGAHSLLPKRGRCSSDRRLGAEQNLEFVGEQVNHCNELILRIFNRGYSSLVFLAVVNFHYIGFVQTACTNWLACGATP